MAFPAAQTNFTFGVTVKPVEVAFRVQLVPPQSQMPDCTVQAVVEAAAAAWSSNGCSAWKPVLHAAYAMASAAQVSRSGQRNSCAAQREWVAVGSSTAREEGWGGRGAGHVASRSSAQLRQRGARKGGTDAPSPPLAARTHSPLPSSTNSPMQWSEAALTPSPAANTSDAESLIISTTVSLYIECTAASFVTPSFGSCTSVRARSFLAARLTRPANAACRAVRRVRLHLDSLTARIV